MSTSTAIVNGALIYILAISALLLFLITFFMIYFLVRYRKSRNPIAQELHDSTLLETVWIIVPLLIVITMFIYGLTGFQFLRKAPGDSLTVKVHAQQWSWLFEYSNGKKSADLIVPLGKNITCAIFSKDVIHGFYIPAFRIHIDAVPGIKTEVWFQATELGSNYILCSQYCGRLHSAMIAKLIVVSEEQFNDWMQGKKIQFSENPHENMVLGQRLLYERGCMSCHSLTGNKMVGPTLKGLFGSSVVVKKSGQTITVTADEAYITESILNPGAAIADGFSNSMPSGRDLLSDDEITEIIKYLKELK